VPLDQYLGDEQSQSSALVPLSHDVLEVVERVQDVGSDIPGVSCVKPKGALYVFPRLDPEVYPIEDDMRFALDLLEQQKILVVQGTGFNWPTTDHFRVVTLQYADDLEEAIARMADFLESRRR